MLFPNSRQCMLQITGTVKLYRFKGPVISQLRLCAKANRKEYGAQHQADN